MAAPALVVRPCCCCSPRHGVPPSLSHRFLAASHRFGALSAPQEAALMSSLSEGGNACAKLHAAEVGVRSCHGASRDQALVLLRSLPPTSPFAWVEDGAQATAPRTGGVGRARAPPMYVSCGMAARCGVLWCVVCGYSSWAPSAVVVRCGSRHVVVTILGGPPFPAHPLSCVSCPCSRAVLPLLAFRVACLGCDCCWPLTTRRTYLVSSTSAVCPDLRPSHPVTLAMCAVFQGDTYADATCADVRLHHCPLPSSFFALASAWMSPSKLVECPTMYVCAVCTCDGCDCCGAEAAVVHACPSIPHSLSIHPCLTCTWQQFRNVMRAGVALASRVGGVFRTRGSSTGSGSCLCCRRRRRCRRCCPFFLPPSSAPPTPASTLPSLFCGTIGVLRPPQLGGGTGDGRHGGASATAVLLRGLSLLVAVAA